MGFGHHGVRALTRMGRFSNAPHISTHYIRMSEVEAVVVTTVCLINSIIKDDVSGIIDTPYDFL